MKSELVDVSETKKKLVIEIPSEVVDASFATVVRSIGHAARVPGFRPGKVPAGVVKQRFREQILHDVVHELVPHAVEEALGAHAVEPLDTPDIQGVEVREGQPLSFTAVFETVPPIDPGDLGDIHLRRHVAKVDDAAVDQALERLRQEAARFEPIEDRGLAVGDAAAVDIERRSIGRDGAAGPVDRHENVSVEIGAQGNPPGFDEALSGLRAGDVKSFRVSYPADYTVADLASTEVDYTVTIRALRRRVVPPLDDDLAKEVSRVDTLEKLRQQVYEGLTRGVAREAERQLRSDLLEALATRVTFEVPTVLLDREIDRRTQGFIRHLLEEGIDPRKAGIDWEAFRQEQREPADRTVRATLVLDEVARRQEVRVSDEDLDREVTRLAERSGRPVATVRQQLDKDNELEALRASLRRERTVEHVMSRATIAGA